MIDDNIGGGLTGEIYTIMSYNICGFDWGYYVGTGSPERTTYYREIAEIVKTNDVALLCMQEVSDGFGEQTNTLAIFSQALSSVSHPMPWFGQTKHDSGSDGLNTVAYCSQYPVSQISELPPDAAVPWEHMRTVQRYKATFPGNIAVWFYGCHFSSAADPWYANLRKSEAKNIAKYIRQHHNLRTDRIVILGDMNTRMAEDWPEGLIADPIPEKIPAGNPVDCTLAYLLFHDTGDPSVFFTSLTHLAIYPTATYMTEPDWFPLDHIILSPALYRDHYVPDSARLIKQGGDAENPSDHYPLICKLKF